MQKQSRLSKFSCFEFSRLKGGGDNFAYVRRGRGVNEKRTGAYKGVGGVRNWRFYCVCTLWIPPNVKLKLKLELLIKNI